MNAWFFFDFFNLLIFLFDLFSLLFFQPFLNFHLGDFWTKNIRIFTNLLERLKIILLSLLSEVKVIDIIEKFNQILWIIDAIYFLFRLVEHIRFMLAHHV